MSITVSAVKARQNLGELLNLVSMRCGKAPDLLRMTMFGRSVRNGIDAFRAVGSE